MAVEGARLVQAGTSKGNHLAFCRQIPNLTMPEARPERRNNPAQYYHQKPPCCKKNVKTPLSFSITGISTEGRERT